MKLVQAGAVSLKPEGGFHAIGKGKVLGEASS